MELDAKQREAVQLCLNRSKRIVAVTGAAGTGKTTIIKYIAEEFDEQDIKVTIAAPTGKAARRITQATGLRAQTVHKLLEYPRPGELDEDGKIRDSGQPKRCRKFPLTAQVVIVDEYAMMNTELDRNVIDALDRGARLLCFGDVNQLAPIEPYKLKKIDETPFEKHLKKTSITLEHIYRQIADGGILHAADRVRKGQMPRRHSDFRYEFTEKPVDYLLEKVSDDFLSVNNQIIVPTKKGWVGTKAVNRLLRDMLNPNAGILHELQLPRNKHDEDPDHPMVISVGDKVVCTENTYDMRDYQQRYTSFSDKGYGRESSFIETPECFLMMNGETGVITKLHDDGSIDIDMGDRTVCVPSMYVEFNYRRSNFYEVDPRRRIDLAYALTTHKCQGSEYDRVMYVINRSNRWMLDRKNFYTAVTRARNQVTVVTDQRGLQMALRPEVRT